MSFNVGENVGPYRVIEQLGQGGMATVYKAYHAALDRYVALKVLHTAFGADPNFEARFQREARLVAKLEHPNIVPIYDYAEHEGRPFLVMKYIEGETLKARMLRGPLTTEELTRIIEAVGMALAYAHKAGILHRDIKPSNVLLTPDGGIYLADFGLARIAAAGESTLSGDMIMGTPQYISPEQAMGKKDLDEGTDIYSFGVMLYEMVVGQVPFNADTPFSIIHDHIYTPLPLPRSVNPNVPEVVERVLLKALAKERPDRYATAADLATAFVQAWLSAGVPMKGTDVTLSRKMMNVPEPEPLPKMDATIPPASQPTPEMAAPAPGVAPEADKVKPKKKFPRWILVAGGILLLLCCLFVFLATRNDRANRGLRATATAQVATLSAVASATPALPPLRPLSRMIEDFEGAPPLASSGWEAYFDEETPSSMECAPTSEIAHSGENSLMARFEVPAHGWATCGFYFEATKDWGESTGVSFFLRSDKAGLPYDLAMYGGTPDQRVTYFLRLETPVGSETEWMLVEVRWDQILRAEWEDNPGTPFNPAEVTGFSIGLSGTLAEDTAGTIWMDDLSLLGQAGLGPQGAGTRPSPFNATPSAGVLEAQRLAEQNPKDARLQLQLSIAYWDNQQYRISYETLTRSLNLVDPNDRAFFEEAIEPFRERQAWVAVTTVYTRLIRTYPPDAPLPVEVAEPFHEAVYMASTTAEFQSLLPIISSPDGGRDQPMALLGQGRSALFASDTTQANDYLEQARALNPAMPEILLLEAEIRFKEGQKEEARRLLEQLVSDTNTPAWILQLAEQYLAQNQ